MVQEGSGEDKAVAGKLTLNRSEGDWYAYQDQDGVWHKFNCVSSAAKSMIYHVSSDIGAMNLPQLVAFMHTKRQELNAMADGGVKNLSQSQLIEFKTRNEELNVANMRFVALRKKAMQQNNAPPPLKSQQERMMEYVNTKQAQLDLEQGKMFKEMIEKGIIDKAHANRLMGLASEAGIELSVSQMKAELQNAAKAVQRIQSDIVAKATGLPQAPVIEEVKPRQRKVVFDDAE